MCVYVCVPLFQSIFPYAKAVLFPLTKSGVPAGKHTNLANQIVDYHSYDWQLHSLDGSSAHLDDAFIAPPPSLEESVVKRVKQPWAIAPKKVAVTREKSVYTTVGSSTNTWRGGGQRSQVPHGYLVTASIKDHMNFASTQPPATYRSQVRESAIVKPKKKWTVPSHLASSTYSASQTQPWNNLKLHQQVARYQATHGKAGRTGQ